jgi:hypothetical protein
MPASNNPWFDFGAIKKTYHVEAPTVKNIISGYATIDFSDQKIGDVKYGLDTYYANNPMRARYVARGLALLYPNSQIDKSSHVAATAIAEWSDTQLIKDLSSESSSRAMTLYNKVKHAPVGFDWTANLFAESDPQIENKVIYKLRGISRHIHDVQDVVQNDVSSQFNIGTLDIPIPANIELQVPIDLDDVDGIPFENHPEEMEITGHRFLEESEGEAVSTTTESIPVEEASNEEILIDDLDKHIAS